MTLYHGSKGGLNGRIQPLSRDACDFGPGFYMGTNRSQCCSLVSEHQKPVLYTCSLEVQNLRVKNLDGVLWVLFIMKNRGYLDAYKSTRLYEQLMRLHNSYDVFVGKIADDKMTDAFSVFLDGYMNFDTLLACVSELSLGEQHVCVSQQACDNVKVLDFKKLRGAELDRSVQLAIQGRAKGKSIFEKYKRSGRRRGLFIDEFIEEYSNGLPNELF